MHVLATPMFPRGMHELPQVSLTTEGPKNRARQILDNTIMTKSQRVTLLSTND